MAARSKARKRALDILFASELRSEDPVVALDRAIEAGEGPTNDYTSTLVRGVVEHRERIDEVLSTYSKGWTLSRMPAVDRNVLRIGVYELLWGDADVPETVAVSEALHLVQDLSTDDSPAFVNGLLGSIQRDRATLLPDPRHQAQVWDPPVRPGVVLWEGWPVATWLAGTEGRTLVVHVSPLADCTLDVRVHRALDEEAAGLAIFYMCDQAQVEVLTDGVT